MMFNEYVHCAVIATIKLIKIPITSHVYPFCVYM